MVERDLTNSLHYIFLQLFHDLSTGVCFLHRVLYRQNYCPLKYYWKHMCMRFCMKYFIKWNIFWINIYLIFVGNWDFKSTTETDSFLLSFILWHVIRYNSSNECSRSPCDFWMAWFCSIIWDKIICPWATCESRLCLLYWQALSFASSHTAS